MAPPEPRYPTTARPEHSHAAETQENDLKTSYFMVVCQYLLFFPSFLLNIFIYFTLQPKFSLPILLSPLLLPQIHLSFVFCSEKCRSPMDVGKEWHIKLRQD